MLYNPRQPCVRRWPLVEESCAFYPASFSWAMCQSPVGRSQCVRCFAVFHDFPDRAFCRDAFLAPPATTGRHVRLRGPPRCPLAALSISSTPSNFSTEPGIFGLAASLNGSIAVALSVIPLASPASGVITRSRPDDRSRASLKHLTGADLYGTGRDNRKAQVLCWSFESRFPLRHSEWQDHQPRDNVADAV